MPRLALGIEPVGDHKRIRVGLEHCVELGIELGDARQIRDADGARSTRAGAHRVLKLSNGRFFELEVLMRREGRSTLRPYRSDHDRSGYCRSTIL